MPTSASSRPRSSIAATGAVALDRTAFYPTGGGQPHDTGALGGLAVTEVRKEGDLVWHTLDGDAARRRRPRCPARSTGTAGTRSMRTHSALHVLCGVIWNEWRVPVTGGNMEPLSARMDFEFDPLPEGFGPRVEELVNAGAGRRPADRRRRSCPGAPRWRTRT